MASAQIEFGVKVTISGPTQIFGIGPKTRVVLESHTPFYEDVVVEGKIVGWLNPGQEAFGYVSTGFQRVPLSIVRRIYSDSCHKNFIGMAAKVLWVQGNPGPGQEFIEKWPLYKNEIVYIDNRVEYWQNWGTASPYPATVLYAPKEIKFPTLPIRSITGEQFANATNYEAHVDIDGASDVYVVGPGEVFFTADANDRDYRIERKLVVRFVQRTPSGDLLHTGGTKDYGSFYVEAGNLKDSHPHAVQYLFGPSDLHRMY